MSLVLHGTDGITFPDTTGPFDGDDLNKGHWSYVSKITLGGATEAIFQSLTAGDYHFICRNIDMSSDNSAIRLTMAESGTTWKVGSSDYVEDAFSNATTYIILASGIGNAAGENVDGYFTVYDVADTTTRTGISGLLNRAYTDGGSYNQMPHAAYVGSTAAIVSIRIYASAGTFTGDIEMYKRSEQ